MKILWNLHVRYELVKATKAEMQLFAVSLFITPRHVRQVDAQYSYHRTVVRMTSSANRNTKELSLCGTVQWAEN
jgi:hypothetical protein